MALVRCIDCNYCKPVSDRSYICTNGVVTETLDKYDLYEPECCPVYKEKDGYITKSQIIEALDAWCNLDEYYHDEKPKTIPVSEVKALVQDIKSLSEKDLLNLIIEKHTGGKC